MKTSEIPQEIGRRVAEAGQKLAQTFTDPFTRQDIGRDRFLIGIGATFGVIALNGVTTKNAEAAGLTWLDDEWGPFSSGVRSVYNPSKILPVLHGPGQVAEIHDRLAPGAHLQEEMADRAADYLRRYPQLVGSLGHCQAFTNAVIYGESGISTRLQRQAAALKHAPDYQVAISPEEAMDYLDQGQLVSGYLADGMTGQWIRTVLRVNRQTNQVLATNYGFPDKWLDIYKEGNGFCIPVHPGAQPLDDMIAKRLNDELPRWERNRGAFIYQNQNNQVLDQIIAGGS